MCGNGTVSMVVINGQKVHNVRLERDERQEKEGRKVHAASMVQWLAEAWPHTDGMRRRGARQACRETLRRDGHGQQVTKYLHHGSPSYRKAGRNPTQTAKQRVKYRQCVISKASRTKHRSLPSSLPHRKQHSVVVNNITNRLRDIYGRQCACIP